MAKTLEGKGYDVAVNVGRSGFRVDLAVRPRDSSEHVVAVLIDSQHKYEGADALDRAILWPGILRDFGWHVCEVLTKDWYERPEEVLSGIVRQMKVPAVQQALIEQGATRRFEGTGDHLGQVWEVRLMGEKFVIQHGRSGGPITIVEQTGRNPRDARTEASLHIDAIRKQGYREAGPSELEAHHRTMTEPRDV